MKKELMKCPDGTYLEVGVLTFDELEAMSDSTFKKCWVFTRNFIRKGMEFSVRVIKALKYSITTH